MKTFIISLTFFLIGSFSQLFAQSEKLVFKGEVSYQKPIGSLYERFKDGMGGKLGVGISTDKNWEWFGVFEYYSFRDNEDKFKIHKKFYLINQEYDLTLPLLKLDANLKVYGVSVNPTFKVLETSIFSVKINGGFGVYYWTSMRSSYMDTLRAELGGVLTDIQILRVPQLDQQDWSGGFYFGFEGLLRANSLLSFYINGSYKNIIGELWPALEIGLENISTFQMIDISAGLRFSL